MHYKMNVLSTRWTSIFSNFTVLFQLICFHTDEENGYALHRKHSLQAKAHRTKRP